MSDDELESALRRALSARADEVEPRGDGLRRIRARTAVSRPRWRVPALAAAGVAVLVGIAVAVPGVLPDRTPPPAAAPTTTAAPTASPVPPRGQYPPIPGAGVNDQPTVWPYPSRRAGYEQADTDQGTGRYGDLTRPDLVALRFLGSYVGSRGLTAAFAGPWKAGLRVEVRAGGRPVSLVYLVPTRLGTGVPYVVVDATAPGLTLNRPPVPDQGPVTARGTVAGGAVPRVQLRTPGATAVLAAEEATLSGTRWSAALTLPPGVRTAALTAWTVGDDGAVAAFTAVPLG